MPAKRFKEIEYHAEQHRQLTVGAGGRAGEVGGAKFDFPGYCHVIEAKAEREVIATQMATQMATHKDKDKDKDKDTPVKEKGARKLARSVAGAECLGRYLDMTDFTGVYKQTMTTLATHLMALERFDEALRIFNGIIGYRIKNGFGGGGGGGGDDESSGDAEVAGDVAGGGGCGHLKGCVRDRDLGEDAIFVSMWVYIYMGLSICSPLLVLTGP